MDEEVVFKAYTKIIVDKNVWILICLRTSVLFSIKVILVKEDGTVED